MNALRSVALAVALLLPIPATAGSASGSGSAEAYVAAMVEEALRELTGEMAHDERERRVDSFLSQHFDLPGLTRFSLGVLWRRITEHERALYAEAFSRFLVRIVAQGLSRYHGEGVRLEPGRDRPESPSETIVRGALDRPNAPALPVAWYLDGRDGRYVVTDIVVADLSLRILFREAASSIAGAGPGGFEKLVETLEQRRLPGVTPR